MWVRRVPCRWGTSNSSRSICIGIIETGERLRKARLRPHVAARKGEACEEIDRRRQCAREIGEPGVGVLGDRPGKWRRALDASVGVDGQARPRLIKSDDAALVGRDGQRAALEGDDDLALVDQKLELGALDVNGSARCDDLVSLLVLSAGDEAEDAAIGRDLDPSSTAIRIVDEPVERRIGCRADGPTRTVEKHQLGLARFTGEHVLVLEDRAAGRNREGLAVQASLHIVLNARRIADGRLSQNCRRVNRGQE